MITAMYTEIPSTKKELESEGKDVVANVKLMNGCGEGRLKYFCAKMATPTNAMTKTIENQRSIRTVWWLLLRINLKTGTVKSAKTTKLIIGQATSKSSITVFHQVK